MDGWSPRLTAHTLVVVASLLTYVLTTRAERERRPPSVAIAWVLGLVALPYLVLPAYLFFGRRKLQRRVTPWSGITPRGEHWAEDLIRSFGLPGAAPAHVQWHGDGAAARDAVFGLIEAARIRLDVCTYIFANDEFGREATRRMHEAARRGVRVRLLIDGVGALRLRRSWLRRLNREGIETAVFSPLTARHTPSPRNLRNHRKWVIADEAHLWAGGRNLAAEYFTGAGGAAPWLAVSFPLAGRGGPRAANNFSPVGRAGGGAPAAGLAPPAAGAASARAQFLPSGPDQTEDTVHALLIDGCYRARRRMLAVTPYFVPDTSLETAMRLAARRGVQIDLCMPASSNHALADFARNRALRNLSGVGVRVHLLPRMNHAKAVVFDETLALCGSVNIDLRSLLLNYESAVVFYGRRDIDWLAAWIEALLPEATMYHPRPAGLWRDIAEGLLLSVAYQL